MSTRTFETTPDGYSLTAVEDRPDDRDLYYQPALTRLARDLKPDRANIRILDQKKEGACTGFGLAGVINLLNAQRGSDTRVSARMLYNMAQKFDRWPGEDYSGSSCRGAIRGWANMGVCSEDSWPYRTGDNSALTVAQAKEARRNSIGAYYRLKHGIVDFHAALNEVGTIFVSANVHPGWWTQNLRKGEIRPNPNNLGGHAFAVVGYDENGFWVQNSWGPGWGKDGLGLWRYEDWQANLKDAWVVRLALPTPGIFPGLATSSSRQTGAGAALRRGRPRRAEIAGHFAHIDDGRFHDNGRYWSNAGDVVQTAKLVASKTRYQHLLFYAHGGLNSVDASAKRVRAMKGVFKANGIYPFHFMYDTGILEEITDVLLGRYRRTGAKVAAFTDYTDRLLESSTRSAGRALWREIKQGAEHPFRNRKGAGSQILEAFLSALEEAGRPKQIHLIGHSAGGILVAYLIDALRRNHPGTTVSSCSLMAPAGNLDLYHSHIAKSLGSTVEKLRVYNLSDKREQDDNVAMIYRKSLLYLVSNAFEERRGTPLLGMQIHSRDLVPPRGTDVGFIYSKRGRGTKTRSISHGGFDNDPYTLNHILKTILGKTPRKKFSAAGLDY